MRLQVWNLAWPIELEVGEGVTLEEVKEYLASAVVQMPRESLDSDAPDIRVTDVGNPEAALAVEPPMGGGYGDD